MMHFLRNGAVYAYFSKTLNTSSIQEDKLKYIQSDVPTGSSEEEKNRLLSHNVTAIVDLRTDEERANQLAINGQQLVCVSYFRHDKRR